MEVVKTHAYLETPNLPNDLPLECNPASVLKAYAGISRLIPSLQWPDGRLGVVAQMECWDALSRFADGLMATPTQRGKSRRQAFICVILLWRARNLSAVIHAVPASGAEVPALACTK